MALELHCLHRSPIMKTYLYNFDPLKPNVYIYSKTGVYKVYIVFLISAQKHRLWVLVRPPRWGSSNKYPQSMLWAEIWKISEFLSEKFKFLVVKFSLYLSRRVCVIYFGLPSWKVKNIPHMICEELASVAQSDACPTGNEEVTGFIPVWQYPFMEIEHEIFSMVSL